MPCESSSMANELLRDMFRDRRNRHRGGNAGRRGQDAGVSDEEAGVAVDFAVRVHHAGVAVICHSRTAKRMYQAARGLSVKDAFELETKEQLTLLGSPNQMEAAMALLKG